MFDNIPIPKHVARYGEEHRLSLNYSARSIISARSGRRPRCLLRWSLFRRMWTDPCLRRDTGPPAPASDRPGARVCRDERGRGRAHAPPPGVALSARSTYFGGGRPSVRLLLLPRPSTGRDPPRCEPRHTYS